MKSVLSKITSYRAKLAADRFLSFANKGKFTKAANILDNYGGQFEKLAFEGEPVMYLLLAENQNIKDLLGEINKCAKAREIYNLPINVVLFYEGQTPYTGLYSVEREA